jgi:hypothetical protein
MAVAKSAGKGASKPDDRVRAYAAAAHAAPDAQAAEAAECAQLAFDTLKADPKIAPPSVGVRVCRVLARFGKFDAAEELAKKLPDAQTQSWARLEVLRGRLAQAKGQKAEDAWLDPVGDPLKEPAAAKAREEIARHNAAHGHDYQAIVKTWEAGKVRPFGTAGRILGLGDKK